MSKDEHEFDAAWRRMGELHAEFQGLDGESRKARLGILALPKPEELSEEEMEASIIPEDIRSEERRLERIRAIATELEAIWAAMPRLMEEHEAPPMMLTQERKAEFLEISKAIDVIHKSAAEGTLVRGPETNAQHAALMDRMRAIVSEAEERAKKSS
jgi:hypothetical protein